MIQQQRSAPLSLTSTLGSWEQRYGGGNEEEEMQDLHLVMHLLQFGQILCEQIQDGVIHLCKEVEASTQGRAHLYLGRQRSLRRVALPAGTLETLPVQFRQLMYGTLCIAAQAQQPNEPAIALPVGRLLAQACSWVLYSLEQATFLHGQWQHLDHQIQGQLTKREREILSLMYYGYRKEAISSLLNISPATVRKHQQHIYEQLGVHSEHDALLVAYHAGLFSLVEEM